MGGQRGKVIIVSNDAGSALSGNISGFVDPISQEICISSAENPFMIQLCYLSFPIYEILQVMILVLGLLSLRS